MGLPNGFGLHLTERAARMKRYLIATIVVTTIVWSGPALGGSPAPAAYAAYRRAVDAYLLNRWSELKEALAALRPHYAQLPPASRGNVDYIRRAAEDCRPDWWPQCGSTRKVSFKARIWDRAIKVNYVPSETLGMQIPLGVRNGRFVVVVSWRPEYVDSPAPAAGWGSPALGLTYGDIGEAIVWHELGHNYITAFLPVATTTRLNEKNPDLFHHLQEFYADLTSLYHCSAKARPVSLLVRLGGIQARATEDPHTRAGWAIGSLWLADVLANRARWPSVRLPASVPADEAERQTIVHMIEKMDKRLTLEEDRALRELIRHFVYTRGDQVLRDQGRVLLGNGQAFFLLAEADQQAQAQRNQWVEAQLRKIIAGGLTTQPAR